jgi:hypothetical protein
MSSTGTDTGTPSDASVSFAADIRPLFREKDRDAMLRAFDLWAYDDVVQHASAIAGKLHEGSMPCDGAWPQENVATFDRWVGGGTPA